MNEKSLTGCNCQAFQKITHTVGAWKAKDQVGQMREEPLDGLGIHPNGNACFGNVSIIAKAGCPGSPLICARPDLPSKLCSVRAKGEWATKTLTNQIP